MKLSLILSMIFLSATAIAAQPHALMMGPPPFESEDSNSSESTYTPVAPSTYFEQLNAMYDQGQSLASADVENLWMSGRWAGYETPNDMKAMLLAVTTQCSKTGPAFPNESKINFMIADGESADYFDNMGAVTMAQYATYVEQAQSETGVMSCEADGSLASTYQAGNIQYRIKKNGAYVVGKAVLLRDMQQGLKAGDTYAAMYFFKKVK